jgi:hypothetical protein
VKNLSPDAMREIALNLSYPEIQDLCKTSKRFNKSICSSFDFWKDKIFHDKLYIVEANKEINLKNRQFLEDSIEKTNRNPEKMRALYEAYYANKLELERREVERDMLSSEEYQTLEKEKRKLEKKMKIMRDKAKKIEHNLYKNINTLNKRISHVYPNVSLYTEIAVKENQLYEISEKLADLEIFPEIKPYLESLNLGISLDASVHRIIGFRLSKKDLYSRKLPNLLIFFDPDGLNVWQTDLRDHSITEAKFLADWFPQMSSGQIYKMYNLPFKFAPEIEKYLDTE